MAEYDITEYQQQKTVPFALPGEKPPPKKNGKKVEEPTQDELEARRKQILSAMGYDETLAKDDPKAPDAPAGDDKPKVDDKPADTTQKPPEETEEQKRIRLENEALEAQRQQEEEAARREEERTTRIATAVASEVAKAVGPKETTEKPVVEELKLDEEDAADLEAVRWMERQTTSKLPKGVTSKTFLDYYKALYAYRDKWEKDNEGKEFNLDDAEHKEFMDKHQPDVSVSDLDAARDEVKFERRFTERVQPRLDAMETQRALETAAPKVGHAINSSIVELARLTSPKIHEIIAKDGKIDMSVEAITAADKADPVGRIVLEELISKRLTPMLTVLEQSEALGTRFPWDQRNAHHAALLDEIAECDALMAAAPASIRVRNGRQFITHEEIGRKSGEILRGTGTPEQKTAALAELNRKYWVLTPTDWRETLIRKTADEAMERINFYGSMAAKQSGTAHTPRAISTAKPAAKPAAAAAKPAADGRKPAAPALPGGGHQIAPPGAPGSGNKSFGETATALHFK